ncbi:MAG: hypothetical protein Q4B60_01440 [Erysipelotrichaceae bacterium]|nr:hypothetical protein [Erysipelotrichaceae bacterium]
MDEYSNALNEFNGSNDEFNHSSKTPLNLKKDNKKLKKMVQLLCSSAVAVTMIATNLGNESNRFYLYGNAASLKNNQFRLAQAKYLNAGALVSDDAFSLKDGLNIEFDFWMGTDPNNPCNMNADGISISFMEEAFDIGDNPQNPIIERGGSLYYHGVFGAEMDLYPNGGDPREDHVAILSDDVSKHFTYKEYEEGLDENVHHLRLECNNTSIYIYLDNKLACEYHELPVTKNKYYLMISSSTGSAWNLSLIKNLKINNNSIQILNPEHNKDADVYQIKW